MSLLDVVQSTAQLNILGSRVSANASAEELEVEAECQSKFIKTLQESFSEICEIPNMLVVLHAALKDQLNTSRQDLQFTEAQLEWQQSQSEAQ